MSRKSISEYPAEWPALSLATKEAAGWRCVRCGHPDDPAECKRLGVRRGKQPCDARCTHAVDSKQRVLTVHHLVGNKKLLYWHNLASLCQVCHLVIQGKVIMDRVWMFSHSTWFKPYVAGFYANRYGLDDSHEYVMAHLDELILLGQNGGVGVTTK